MSNHEANKRTVRAYVDAINDGDIERLRTLFAPDAHIQGVTGNGTFDYAARVWHDLHHGLAMTLEVQSMIAEGDIVAARFTERGRWIGPFLDFKEPTGLPFELVAIEWFEFRDGKITGRWGVRDSGSQARQVGFPIAASGPAKSKAA